MNAHAPEIRIRKSFERADWAYLRELCARTGNSGAPIDPVRWPFFGEQWIGPYEKLRPDWAYLAEDARSGARLGYLTGCPDTRTYLRERKWLFDLPLFLRVVAGEFLANGDTKRFTTRFLGRDRGPEECFARDVTEQVWEEYPAHLHVNLEAAARGSGIGRHLVDQFRSDLSLRGINGIHLYCGDKPLPFYFKIGFTEIDRIEFRPGVFVYRLGSRF